MDQRYRNERKETVIAQWKKQCFFAVLLSKGKHSLANLFVILYAL